MQNIRYIGALALVLLFVAGIPALQATPIADLTYVETDMGGGLWQYEYTLTNLADPIEDAGYDLYDLFLGFDESATVEVIDLPLGWEFQTGLGFIDIYSGIPGVAPSGSDIAPGKSLSGFVLQFDHRAGDLPFDVTFTSPSSVPEPSTYALVFGGLAGLAFFRKYRPVSGDR